MSREPVDPAANLRLAFEMFEVGVAMMREKLRWKSPSASAEEIDRQLDRWLLQVDEALPSLGTHEDHEAAVEAQATSSPSAHHDKPNQLQHGSDSDPR